MTKQETIVKVCDIVAVAYHSIGDFNKSSDCFCNWADELDSHYHNDGVTIAYVRKAVVEQLKKDGFDVKE